MDTDYGRILRSTLTMVSDRAFCQPMTGLSLSFQACRLLSYNPSGKARFNVLQYAHSVNIEPFIPSADSSSLKIFHSCWDLLLQICGANATYYDYLYRVSAGSREIQRMMDNLTCEWQGMLIYRYIEASEHGNMWPTPYNEPENPMCLSKTTNITFGALTNSMSDLLSVVDRGVKEISNKCSMASAKRIKLFYHRVKYGWYTELKMISMLINFMRP